ncbi:hypothetical protein UT300005_32830 [Clostridium sp. CTA-5]
MVNKYPICDSDLIIKLCKCKKYSELFEYYKIINFTDAVYQEICSNLKLSQNKNVDLNFAFNKAFNVINDNREKGKAKIINLFEQNSDIVKIINKHLRNENIIYDNVKKQYVLGEDLGEKVSIIYAAVLGISIILSDDKGSKEFVKKFMRVKVIRLNEVLSKFGLNDKEIKINNFIANHKYSSHAFNVMKEYRETGKLKDIFDMGILHEYKSKRITNR